jgi:hypothetical protein
MPSSTTTTTKGESSGRRRLRPKPEVCRAKTLVHGKVVECVTPDGPTCCCALPFGDIRLCVAPEREEYVARTNAEQAKKKQ